MTWDEMSTDERIDFNLRLIRGEIMMKEYYAVRDRYFEIFSWAYWECEARIRDFERATDDGMPLPQRWAYRDTPMPERLES